MSSCFGVHFIFGSKGGENFYTSLRGGQKILDLQLFLESLGVNKYTIKKLGENKAIRESYSDFRYLPPPNP